MSRKIPAPAAPSPKATTTVDQALGPLTQQAVDDAGDATNKKYLTEARNIALGLATLILVSTDPQDQAVVQILAKVNVGIDDVEQISGLAGTLITAAADRDAAEAAARAATARLEDARTKLHDTNTSFANLARSKLGAKSAALEKFGIKPIGGRKGAKRASKKGAADKKDSKDTSKDSGTTPNDSGTTPKS
jgi:hypothetical protein